jgi:uncharacterized membrane protein YqaE (UPF0057 family)
MKKLFWISLVIMICFAPSVQAASVIVSPATEVPVSEVNRAVNEFNNLSRKDKKARIQSVKKELKSFRKQKDADEKTILYVILAILLPPLAVYLHQDAINTKFWISLILTLLFWVPGVIYSLLVVLDVI